MVDEARNTPLQAPKPTEARFLQDSVQPTGSHPTPTESVPRALQKNVVLVTL